MVLALLLLVIWPIAEVFVAIQVADAIGVLPTILLLIVTWPLGTWAMRSQGRAAWRRLSAAVAQRRPPAAEVIDGALVLVGGFLLILPGFITDVLGICLLLPPTRWPLRALMVRNIQSRLLVQAVRFTRGGRPYDVDSTAADVDQPRLRP
jgi:UPF0716 protein FxsA